MRSYLRESSQLVDGVEKELPRFHRFARYPTDPGIDWEAECELSWDSCENEGWCICVLGVTSTARSWDTLSWLAEKGVLWIMSECDRANDGVA